MQCGQPRFAKDWPSPRAVRSTGLDASLSQGAAKSDSRSMYPASLVGAEWLYKRVLTIRQRPSQKAK